MAAGSLAGGWRRDVRVVNALRGRANGEVDDGWACDAPEVALPIDGEETDDAGAAGQASSSYDELVTVRARQVRVCHPGVMRIAISYTELY